MCLAALAASILWVAAEGRAATDVLVNNYDDFRTGANLTKSILNVSNVGPETFGRLFSYSVDGAVFGQPLVVSGVSVPNGGLRDIVYVTTANNSVYAFDAHGGSGAPLWQKSLTRLPNGSYCNGRRYLQHPGHRPGRAHHLCRRRTHGRASR